MEVESLGRLPLEELPAVIIYRAAVQNRIAGGLQRGNLPSTLGLTS